MTTASVDFHSHLIPGVDDGARDLDASRAALEQFRDAGVGAVVTTPHCDGDLTADPDALEARLADLDAGWEKLRALARDEFPDLRLERGVELALTTPEPELSDERLRLAGGRFVLVEFPRLSIPPRSPRVLSHIKTRGRVPVVAHPERYAGAESKLELMGEWRRVGARLQVNGGSLTGVYGRTAERVAGELLGRGWADYLSSDDHARGRLALGNAREALERRGGQEQARLLMETNPRRLLEGDDPLPVPALTEPSWWERVRAVFG